MLDTETLQFLHRCLRDAAVVLRGLLVHPYAVPQPGRVVYRGLLVHRG